MNLLDDYLPEKLNDLVVFNIRAKDIKDRAAIRLAANDYIVWDERCFRRIKYDPNITVHLTDRA